MMDVPDYRRMYITLLKAVDSVIEPLGEIPLARPSVCALETAMLDVERIYIETSAYLESTSDDKVIQLKIND